jgi:hypothetical protein
MMKMPRSLYYRYETHLHTRPASKCARRSVRENLEFYKSLDYAGVFITNHFIDGNAGADKSLSYEEQIRQNFADYLEGVEIGRELGIDVFMGTEMSYKGTDFLIYGLDIDWYLSHPEIMDMKKSEELPYLAEAGALIIHAHPYREAGYIDHIRLFPRCVHGVEIYNANRTDLENRMAREYAKSYSLIPFAGSDNHVGGDQLKLGGIEFISPLSDEIDFVDRIKNLEGKIFKKLIKRNIKP